MDASLFCNNSGESLCASHVVMLSNCVSVCDREIYVVVNGVVRDLGNNAIVRVSIALSLSLSL